MKAFFGFVALAAGLALNVMAADDASELKVSASSDLRIAIVDGTRAGTERDTVHEAFANSLAISMSKQCGGAVNVKLTDVEVFRVGFELKAGMYDAAFIVGNVPAILKKGDYEIIRAMSDVGSPARVFHMVVPADDANLKKMLSASFGEALASTKFQEALSRAVAVKINADAIRNAVKESVADSTR
jgi:hypothetical protein